ncbi:MAG: glycosyltransferase family 4 protein [Thermoplasmata archaeon]
MSEIKVRLFINTHVFYKDLYLYPPNGVTWIGKYNVSDFENLKLYEPGPTLIRNLAKKFYDFLNSPRFAYLYDAYKCDLIYSGRGVLILNKKPWVIDYEHVSHFVGLDRQRILKKDIQYKILKFLKSKYCKKILPHTKAAYNSFTGVFGNILNDKTEILYHTMHPTPLQKRPEDDKIVILFNGNFYHKSGDIALEIFKKLNEQYNNLEMTVISNPPVELINKYKKNYPNISFYKKGPGISRDQLINDFYMKSDIFLYPSQGDSNFPAVLLGMNAALPVVCSDYYAFPEVIQDGVNGFLIHSHLGDIERKYPEKIVKYWEGEDVKIIREHKSEFISEAYDKMCKLIEDSILRRTMGMKGRKMLETGKFSIKKRNEQLLKIFNEIIKN